ncbi:hypothetical protein MKX47_06780 [Solibacillus sp. FSL R7-0668]|uniref:hypothetical protein n=1 Tax=Solibacillus sp. FSL R7-0668 TaxID=2921688 RepID=UPI0030FCBB41
MLEQQKLEQLTIQALSAQAKINRVTFYKYFQNLADFHDQFVTHYILELYEVMSPFHYKPYSIGFEYGVLLQLLEHIQENHKPIKFY